ncbi:hypothetical protein [uncultured Thiodictyon sp.]|uniref:hypothetical protein n=1 Tax=uncultured Thiodictyon sp. TaxID=1846217 RepID=UPI0025CEDDF8|nr:hypothetical protein [uncultured Thiodictyon sp.]
MGQPAVSRGDLLRCLHSEGRDALTAMAGLAGYRRVPKAKPTPAPAGRLAAGPVPVSRGSTPAAPSASPPADAPGEGTQPVGGLPFYRVVGYRSIERESPPGERPDWYHAARPFAPGEQRQQRLSPPVPEPLIPWPRLWPFLRAALGDWTERREPDLKRLVDLIACGQAPRRLPRQRLHRWAPACQLILDLSPRLTPFHGDYWRLLPALGRLRGHLGRVLSASLHECGALVR